MTSRLLGDALEAGDDDDAPRGQLALDALRLDGEDAGAAVDGVGAQAGLGAGEADRLDAEGVQGHRHQGLETVSPVESRTSSSRSFGVVGDLVGQRR